MDGRDVVLPFDESQIPPAFSGAVLAPWPNRLRDGEYTYAGDAYEVPLTKLTPTQVAYDRAGVIGHVHVMTVRGGVISALFVWAGFVATTTVVTQQFEGQKPLLTAIDVGHWLAVLVVMGVIIGLFGA